MSRPQIRRIFGNSFINANLFICSIHVLALVLFGALRAALYLSYNYSFTPDTTFLTKATCFLKGLWFDNVVCCYISIIPLASVWILSLVNCTRKWLFCAISYLLILLYGIATAITTANIPYFRYFFKNINSSIYEWIETTDVAIAMIAEEKSYIIYIAAGIILIILLGIAIIKLRNCFYRHCCSTEKNNLIQFITTLITGTVLCGACIFGIRGRMGYNPIKVSQAYYCNNPFLNQVGINPVFNLLTSTLDDRKKENRQLSLTDADEAIKYVKQALGRNGIDNVSPIAQKVVNDSLSGVKYGIKKPNIVFVFMESMSASLMNRFGNNKELTPFIDSLYSRSLSFSNIFSQGIHTNHGIYSTLYSFPVIMKRNAMKGSVVQKYSGLPTVLKQNGYRNLFFMTHESQYDNMNAFLRTNGFDEIYAQENYPSDKIVNSFGVQDDFLYSYALNRLDDIKEEPFFAVLLSISNHPPYIVPKYFKPKSSGTENQIVEYADWAIKGFMEEASKSEWFDNTIFVFIGDHGKLVGDAECEVPQSYNHIPLMIYHKDIAASEISKFGNQTDVAPTLLSLLGINYVQNNFGTDLLHQEKPFTYYCSDNLIVCRNSKNLYIYEPKTGCEFTYTITADGLHPEKTETHTLMKSYLFNMLQAAEKIVKGGLTTDGSEQDEN